MDKKKLKMFQKLLLKERSKILEALNYDKAQFDDFIHGDGEIGDVVDKAFNQYEKIMAIEMTEKEKEILREINNALVRIKNGTYGKCRCGKKITQARLKAIPWATQCIKCKNNNSRVAS
ncbi:MAG TPA: TraR/DksA family transcriptional regulator [Spirochaetota bacterium]|nr:TraR/DksA family transcriptional regulator [Spirochaetota bacterium]